MAADVEEHQREAVGQERLKRELELGRQIQHDMLPQGPLKLGLAEVKGVSVPAREVGGDFFNYFPIADGQVALLVGDVSGKGVGAALLMANVQASLRTRLALGQDLAAIAGELDVEIEASTPVPVYATLFVAIFDPRSRSLRYVNAGHHPQFVVRARGGLDRMPSSGLPIGLLAGHGYTEARVELQAGDRLFFYTDGCVEAEGPNDDMFGASRLEAVLTACGPDDDLLAMVERAVTDFRAGRDLFDDITMMAVSVG
jgi:sigma-B regulation protein RsbU (phosphoserine phosphatase)